MPIAAIDISMRLSGGATNTLPLSSIGGIKSSTSAASTLFDNVDSTESAAGDIEYRCIYIHCAVAATEDVKAWLAANTPSANTTIDIGVGTSVIDGTEQTVANENTAPTGVTFSAPTTSAAGLSLGILGAGQSRAIWMRRTVNVGATAVTGDSATLRITAA